MRNNLQLKDTDDGVRIYIYVKGSDSTGRHFYKCMRCVNMSKGGTTKYSVQVTVLDGVVLQVTGVHHPECKPTSAYAVRASEIDRCQRKAVRQGFKTAQQAYTDVRNCQANLFQSAL